MSLRRSGPPKRRTPLKPRATGAKGKRTKERRARQHGGAFGAFVRSHLCAAYRPSTLGIGRPCGGRNECARVPSRGAHPELDGPGHCVCLCTHHHSEQGSAGIVTFQQRYGIDLEAIAARLGKEWNA